MPNQLIDKPFLILLFPVFFMQLSHPQNISQSVRVCPGAINGVFIERNGENLVVYGDPNGEIQNAEMVLFTHSRRDVVWAGRNLVQKGSLAIVPAEEKTCFTGGDSVWTKLALTRFRSFHFQTTKIGISSLDIHRFINGGEELEWQDLDIRVRDTPGYTRGSVSYIADIEGKRYAFDWDLREWREAVFEISL